MSARSVTGNQSDLNKGVAKKDKRNKVFETLVDRDKGKRTVRVNPTTEVYAGPEVSNEEVIRRYNERYGV